MVFCWSVENIDVIYCFRGRLSGDRHNGKWKFRPSTFDSMNRKKVSK